METRTSGVVIRSNAIEHLDNRADVDIDACLLAHFARDGGVEPLTELHGAAGNTPLPLEWFAPAANQQDRVSVQHDSADADDRSRREFPIGPWGSVCHGYRSTGFPITLTTTRFFR